MTQPLLRIENLVLSFRHQSGQTDVVHGFNLEIARGETVGIVGESGSGKTMSMLAATRLLPRRAFVSDGCIELDGQDLLAMSNEAYHRNISGKRVAMIFQEPMTALNPVYTIGRQLMETVMHHQRLSRYAAKILAIEMLEAVRLPNPIDRLEQYPHELSGGQRQRVMIAMALMNRPDLLIADEPTTALDVTVQNEIIQLLLELQERFGMAIVFISHNLGVVSRVSNRIIVMCQGEVVEEGETRRVLLRPAQHYTQCLLSCLWKLDEPAPVNENSSDDIITVSGISKSYKRRSSWFSKTIHIHAARGISFSVKAGETLAIVGESGSGKSTIAKIINGLELPDAGEVLVSGQPVTSLSGRARARLMQPIFQDPYSSLNPKHTISDIIARPLLIHASLTKEEVHERVIMMLEKVGLSSDFYNRFPSQLSGGQRQRVAIAKAIILEPRILLCDEPTSALDVSIQAQILELLAQLKSELNITLLLISHDIAVVRHISDRVLVMLNGEIVERGAAAEVLYKPKEKYTQDLLRAVYQVPKPLMHGGTKV